MSLISKLPVWLEKLNDQLKGEAQSADFLYVLKILVLENKYDFLDMLKMAEEGYGLTLHEGLMYSLENDWDNPSDFDLVRFFVGGEESSSMSINLFVNYLDSASIRYVDEIGDRVALEKIAHIKMRYSL